MTRMTLSLSALLLIISYPHGSTAQTGTELLWSTSAGWSVNSVAAVGDVSANGIDDVFAGASDDKIYCIEGGGPLAGTKLWSATVGGDVWVVAAIADLNGDGRDDCLAGASDNTVYCISGNSAHGGAGIWSTPVGGDVWSLAVIGDVNEDGAQDCIVGCADNRVYCLSGAGAGQILWQHLGSGDVWSISRADDVNGDGVDDCFAGASDNRVYCLSGKLNTAGPRLIWSYSTGGDVWAVGAIGDVNGDGVTDCLAGTGDNKVHCLSGNDGHLLWSFSTGGDVWSVAAIGDVNDDGKDDCLAGGADNLAYCLSGSNGGKLWERSFNGDVWAVAALPDIDGDGRPDCAVGTGDDDIAAIGGGASRAGQVLWSVKAAGDVRTIAPCGDLNGNGLSDIVSGSYDSFIRAFEGNSLFYGVAVEESLALVDLYNSTNGASWANHTDWLSKPVNWWHGITVIDHHVVAVELDANLLSGTIPASIGDLAHLEILGLAANDLSGSIPPEIGHLANLTGLYLQSNRLSGAVPVEAGDLSQLQHLWIQDNRLDDLPDLHSLPNITDLRVGSNRFNFRDIEPNVGVSSWIFNYSPQDSIGQAMDTTVAAGESITFTVSAGGSHTYYQWMKNGVDIPAAADSSYAIISAAGGDAGRYVCRMTNTVAPELTLYSRPVQLGCLTTGISDPAGGDLWIAGQKSTIRWQLAGSTVEITLSLDGGLTFGQAIAASLPNTGQYIWDIPDTTLSRKCVIRIESDSNPSTVLKSDVFRIKPYLLTRLTPDGQYESYRLEEDAWSFPDDADILWPEAWWGGDPPRFDYSGGIDPVTDQEYPEEFIALDRPPEIFPDWPLFVSVFGTDRCYWDVSEARYRQSAISYWDSFAENWGGSCAGLAASSFMAFDDPARFQGEFPVGDFENLHDLSINSHRRKTINMLSVRAMGRGPRGHIKQSWNKTPKETLVEIKGMLLGEAADNSVLYMVNQSKSAARAVNPVSLAGSTFYPGMIDVSVYDGESPNVFRHILIDTLANTWEYEAGWGGGRGLFLMQPVSNDYGPAILSKGDSFRGHPVIDGADLEDTDIEFYNAAGSFVTIYDQHGDSIGYADSSVFDGLPGGIPIIPAGGSFRPPIGYGVSRGEYSVRMRNSTNSEAYFRAFTDSLVFDYGRSDAAAGQSDLLTYGHGFSLRNPDGQARTISLETIVVEESSEKVFDIIDTQVSPADSVHRDVLDRRDLKMINIGSDKTYHLRLKLVSAEEQSLFEFGGIFLPGNSSHLISPDWEDLANQPVIISIDLGNDGSIDNSLVINNDRTAVEQRGFLDVPTEYALSQNYPNPFNPTTVMNYSLPRSEEVSLVVYNVLGQRVATLIQGLLPAGRHSVSWDASGVSSGMYFARLEAGEYVKSVKMLLLK